MPLDPITLEVCWSRLISVVNEQANALQRSSFSSVVREAGDLSAGLFDRRGRMVAQAVTGTPGHINTMAQAMRAFLATFPLHDCVPGDVFITNDPWNSSGHLNDVTTCSPIFHRDRLVGFFCSCCHTSDIGGRVLSAEAKDVYEEGLFIPVTRFLHAGKPDALLEALLRANTRTPDLLLGDIDAQIVGGAVGGERLCEFLDEFGLPDLESLSDQIVDRTEAALRTALRAIPEDAYRYEIVSDGFDKPVRIRVACTVRDGGIEINFDGSSPESSYGINVPLTYTTAYSTYGLKALISPDVPNNEGSFRAVRVTAPAGSIVNAQPPAPVAGRHVIGHFLPNAVVGALSPALPDRAIAEGAASICGVQVRGRDLHNVPFTYVFFLAGGTGARPNADGLSATGFPSALLGTPLEVVEAASPLVIERRALIDGSGGSGKYRGGLGQSFRSRVRTNKPFTCSILCDRTRTRRAGFSAEAMARGRWLWVDGRKIEKAKSEQLVPPGASIEIRLAGGGGYGPAAQRDPALVARDRLERYVI